MPPLPSSCHRTLAGSSPICDHHSVSRCQHKNPRCCQSVGRTERASSSPWFLLSPQRMPPCRWGSERQFGHPLACWDAFLETEAFSHSVITHLLSQTPWAVPPSIGAGSATAVLQKHLTNLKKSSKMHDLWFHPHSWGQEGLLLPEKTFTLWPEGDTSSNKLRVLKGACNV